MEDFFGKAVPFLQVVLPGFLATFIFYWLSDSQKPGQFERVIQALIGTAIIQFLASYIQAFALMVGEFYCLGVWTEKSSAICSACLAVAFGLLLAYLGNNDILYRVARKMGLTHRSADGSDWRFAHRTLKDRSIVLQLLDGRRLAGYPRSWPTDPEKGHYLMQFPTWIENDQFVPAEGVSFMLVSGVDVQWTEFLEPVKDEEDD